MDDAPVNLPREVSRYVETALSNRGTLMTGSSALASLIGRTRALVLADIGAAGGHTTTEIARRLGSARGVGSHLLGGESMRLTLPDAGWLVTMSGMPSAS